MCTQSFLVQKNTLRICIKHVVCINLLDSFFNIYWSTCLNITHYQSRHHNPVENPSLWHHLFLKVHHSIQIITPTYSSICLPCHIFYGFSITKRVFFSIIILIFKTTYRYVLGVAVASWNLHIGYCWFPLLKNLYNLQKIFNHTPLLSISVCWPWFPLPQDLYHLKLRVETFDSNLNFVA